MKFLNVVRKILGKLTDILLVGREAGLWQKKPGVGDVVDFKSDNKFDR